MLTARNWQDPFLNALATERHGTKQGQSGDQKKAGRAPISSSPLNGHRIVGLWEMLCTHPATEKNVLNELLIPMTNTDVIYYLEEKILVQMNFAVEFSGKERHYLQYKICFWQALLYSYKDNGKDKVKDAFLVNPPAICFIGYFLQCDSEGFYSTKSET